MTYCYIFHYTTPGDKSWIKGLTEPLNIKCMSSDMLLNVTHPTGRAIINMRNVTHIEEIIEEEKHYFPELKESEDERIIKALKEGFKYHQAFNPTFGRVPCTEIVAWLESLKQRFTWKPSDEQMSALDAVIDEYDGYPEFDSLVSLKNDLKKLIEVKL